jgi:hypothetical protein
MCQQTLFRIRGIAFICEKAKPKNFASKVDFLTDCGILRANGCVLYCITMRERPPLPRPIPPKNLYC